MAAGILSGWFGQSAFNAGSLSLSLPVIDTVEPVCSVILVAAVFHEHLARSPGLLAFQLAGGAIAAAGIALLSILPSCWRRSAANPGRPGSRKSTELLNGKPFPGRGLLATRSVELLAETPAYRHPLCGCR